MKLSIRKWLGVAYDPDPEARSFLDRKEVQAGDNLEVTVAVLDSRESQKFFGVPMARRGMQPIWLELANRSEHLYHLDLVRLDPNYFSPLEAAFVNHFATGKRLAGFGLLAWIFLPFLVLLPFKFFGARKANRRMNAYFLEQAIGRTVVAPQSELSGFVFTQFDEGTKEVRIRLLGADAMKDFSFSINVPGLEVGHSDDRFAGTYPAEEVGQCTEDGLREFLEAQPRATANKGNSKEGDPLNLVIIGEFTEILQSFGARWDETESIDLATCWKTCKAFLFGSRYRYSPVSPLYLAGRQQDLALQRARQTINERLHLRLWLMPMRYEGKPVWVGQVSRDIGVRFTLKTWNLTTHKIDSNVDEAREYVLGSLVEARRLSKVGYVPGVGACDEQAPRRNLTGDPYVTDGLRAVAVLAGSRTTPASLGWT